MIFFYCYHSYQSVNYSDKHIFHKFSVNINESKNVLLHIERTVKSVQTGDALRWGGGGGVGVVENGGGLGSGPSLKMGGFQSSPSLKNKGDFETKNNKETYLF